MALISPNTAYLQRFTAYLGEYDQGPDTDTPTPLGDIASHLSLSCGTNRTTSH